MEFISSEVETKRTEANKAVEGKKLLVGETVEVLRFVEESYVSLFIGIVTDCESCSRIVKSSNMMHNGVYSRIIESIPVSEAIEGKSTVVEESYSGRIRPLPPQHNLEDPEITFGQCVDVFIAGSWREVVVVGRKDDSIRKLIFFPDTSDDVLVPASKIRLTREWDEVSGHWRHRIINEFEQQNIVLSKIQEIWFNLNAKATFREKIKVWFSVSKLTWNDLLSDVIRGIKLAVSSLPATHSSSCVQKLNGYWGHEGVRRSSNVGTFPRASTSHTFNCCTTTPNQLRAVRNVYTRKQNCADPHILASGGKCIPEISGHISVLGSYAEMKEVDGLLEDEKFRNFDEASKILLSNVCDNKIALENKKAKKNLVSRAWEPVELEGEYCHDLLKLSCSPHVEFKKHSMKNLKLACLRAQKVKFRKHLVSIGWRIESKRDTMVRFRYISPEQSTHYSLIKVFQYLLKLKAKMSGKARDKGNSKHISSKNSSLEIPPAMEDFGSLKHDKIMHPIDDGFSATQQTAELLYHESDSSELMNYTIIQSNSHELIGENEQTTDNCLTTVNEILDSKENNISDDIEALHLSEAVIKAYIDHIEMLNGKPKLSSADAKELRLKTKDFLFEKGWKFWLYDRKVRLDLRYTSPNGRTYRSLYTACKGYMEEVHSECTRKMSLKNINDDTSFYDASNNLAIITPNKGEVHEHPCGSGLTTSNNQKPLVMQQEGLVQGPFSSSNLSDSGEFNSKEEHLDRKRELKRRKIDYPSTHVSLDKRPENHLIENCCDQKYATKADALGASSSHKPTGKSFTSRVLHSGKRSVQATVLSSNDQVAKTVLSLLIDKDVVLPRQKVAFVRKIDGHIMKEGWITRDGIECRCCLNVFSLSQFGAHAGSRTSRPSASIILQDGRSLLDCQKQIICAFKPEEFHHARLRSNYSDNDGDDVCTVCRDGGLIMLCDLCSSAFHQTCIGLEDVPQGKWLYTSCRCGICGLSDFNCDTQHFTQKSRICCDQCERQYHVGCLQKQGLQLKKCPTGTWTCSKGCSKIIFQLRLLGKSNLTEIIGENEQTTDNCLTTVNETLDSKESDIYEDTKALHLSEAVIKAYMDHIEMLKDKPKLSSADAKKLRLMTKDFLLEKDWSLWLYDKKVRRELRYTSPNGRTYISLYTACKGYLEEVHPECTRKLSFKNINDDKSSFAASNSVPIISPNKEEVHELPYVSGLITSNIQKPLVMQQEGLVQGPFSSTNLSESGEFNCKEQHLGRKRRKIDYPNTHVALDNRLQNHLIAKCCEKKNAAKMDALGASSTHKASGKKFTSRVQHSGKRSLQAMILSSKDQVAKTVLSWLIDKDVVLPRQKVAFIRKIDGRIMKEGWIARDGIKCRCCLNVFPLSQFGAHAGSRTSRPSASIILQDGRSLLDCQKQIICTFKPKEFQHARLRSNYSDYEGDDVCSICRDGGLIMLCDLCPSAFHPTCIGLEGVPQGKWFCPSCRCGICGLSEFNCDTQYFTQKSWIYCDQCERQYHVGCLQKQGLQLKKCPTGSWTCSKRCSKIISHLRLLLGKSHLTSVKGLSWTILKSNSEDTGKLDDAAIVENSGMLHIALDVLHECFEIMVEARTHSDLAADVIFNKTSELNRLNFSGFYTMVLMSGDELVCVATFRIFGERLAEMPFICTRVKFRRQGMCRLLMIELQKLLSSLGVERLLLPAVPELLKTWTSSFGFTKITSSDRLEFLEHTLVTFQGTTMCQKFLKKPSVSTG